MSKAVIDAPSLALGAATLTAFLVIWATRQSRLRSAAVRVGTGSLFGLFGYLEWSEGRAFWTWLLCGLGLLFIVLAAVPFASDRDRAS